MSEELKMRGDLGSAFNRIVETSFFRYKGYLAERTSDHLLLFKGHLFNEAGFKGYVDDLIEAGAKAIQNSLNRIK